MIWNFFGLFHFLSFRSCSFWFFSFFGCSSWQTGFSAHVSIPGTGQGPGTLHADSPGICSWQAKERGVQGTSLPKAKCLLEKFQSQVSGLGGGCQLAPIIYRLWGLEGKSWQVVPSGCDLLAEPMADFPAFPVQEGWGPCEAKLWDSSIPTGIVLFAIRQLWALGCGLELWEWETDTSILSPDVMGVWIFGTHRACTAQRIGSQFPSHPLRNMWSSSWGPDENIASPRTEKTRCSWPAAFRSLNCSHLGPRNNEAR